MIESGNLKGAAARGLFWSTIDRFGAQGIQFLFGVLITRLLLPEDYGLLGMILIFMALGQTLTDSGFGSALIWKKNTTQTDYSTVFYFNIFISLVLYVLFFFLAPLISDFYNEPLLTDLIRVLSLNFIILSFSLIQQIDFQKRVDFKALATINIVASVLAGALALYIAWKGFGVWALIIQIITKSFITSILLWVFSSWKPILVFNLNSLKHLFNYGSKLMVAGLIYSIFNNLYFNIIGKLFPVAALGFYTRAVQLQEFPVKTISSIFNRVAFPVFASIQEQNERLRNAFKKTLKSMMFVMFPVIFGLIAVADELIELLFTEKWLPASPYFKLLCLAGAFYVFQVANGELLKTKGMSNWVLRLEIISKTILIVNIFLTYRWGITAIIYGQIVTSGIAALLGSYYVWKLIDFSLWQQFKVVLPYLVVSAGMYLMVEMISWFIDRNMIALIIMTISGIIFYFLAALLFKLDEMNDIKMMIRKFKKLKMA